MIFFENHSEITLPASWDETKIRQWIKKCLKKFQYVENQLVINFLNDKQLLELNQRIFNHNYFTDTITLRYPESKNRFSSDIYISLERVRQNSSRYRQTYFQELLRVIIHSVLHAIGYDDHTDLSKANMRCLENLCLSYYS